MRFKSGFKSRFESSRFKSLVVPLFLLFALVALFSVFPTSASTAAVNVTITPPTAWWNKTVVVNGTAKYTNGSAIPSASIAVTMTGKSLVNESYCTNTTNSGGEFSCTFASPKELGTYDVRVYVTKDGETFTGSNWLTVKLTFGESYTGTEDRVVYEVPMLLQDMTGRIKTALVRVIIWRGT